MSFFPDDLSAKRLELLKEALPGASRVAVFSDHGQCRYGRRYQRDGGS